MSMWNLEFEGFPPQWLDVVERFENGTKFLYLPAKNEREAIATRFEWYAFKRRLRQLEQERERMYPTVPRIKATVGQLRDGRWVLKLAVRDIELTAQALDKALAMTEEEMDELDTEFQRGALTMTDNYNRSVEEDPNELTGETKQ